MRTAIALLAGLIIAATAHAEPQARKRAAPARPSITVMVTDMSGNAIEGVSVRASGATKREANTNAEGSVVLENLAAGDYRLRLEHEGHITLERDVTVAKKSLNLSIALDAAPAPPAPEPTAAQPAETSAVTMNVAPSATNLPDFIEKNYIGSAPSATDRVACTASGTASVIQLEQPLAEHTHDDVDEYVYVVAGEGTEVIGGKTFSLVPGVLAVVPRGTAHSLARKGSRPLIVLSMLSGKPCEGGQ
jgi:mannose-6-phosphate isomerase-like protein (cupin superfamily)